MVYEVSRCIGIELENGFERMPDRSLITEAVLAAAVRTFPGDSITAHPPQILQHAVLADAETASAFPAEWNHGPTAMTIVLFGFTVI